LPVWWLREGAALGVTSASTLDQILEMHLQLGSALWPLAEFDRISACLEEAERLALSSMTGPGWAGRPRG
jgi:hypothetical protein